MTFILSACAASIPIAQLEQYAFIRAGSTNFFSFTSGGPTVSLTAIDGKPSNLDNGPLAVEPGNHSITMECGGNENSFELNFSAGEIYEYAVGYGGQKGCLGRLFKVN